MGKVAMKEGVKGYVHRALDVKDEVAAKMIEAGVAPLEALKASTVVTKDSMDALIDRHFDNASASEFTITLTDGVSPTLN